MLLPDELNDDGEAQLIELLLADHQAAQQPVPASAQPAAPAPTAPVEDRQHLAALLASSPHAINVLGVDGHIEYVNAAFEALTGYSAAEAVGHRPAELLRSARHEPGFFAALWQQVSSGAHWAGEITSTRKNGTPFTADVTIAPVFDACGEITGFITMRVDVTERRRAEAALRQSQERYALAARGANDGLWDWDLTRDEVYLSARWNEMLGCRPEERRVSRESWLARVHPRDRHALDDRLDAHLAGREPSLQSEHRLLHDDGTYHWMLWRGVALTDEAGEPYRMAGSQTDITRWRDARDQLYRAAFHDDLTGLANRALFVNRLEHALKAYSRRGHPGFAVLFIDVDRFKLINDSLGHAGGDELLIAIGERVLACVRPGDTVARHGGDEFGVLLENVNSRAEATAVADRVVSAFSVPIHIQGTEVFTNVSIGISLANTQHADARDVLRDADTAMYRAKAQGGCRYSVFDSEMRSDLVHHVRTEAALRHALERNEFRIHYQPIVTLDTGRVIGFEALLRWIRPGEGMVYPGDFIPIAEETGLIIPIGYWVLRNACRQINAWNRLRPDDEAMFVSVNLSSRQFAQPDLVEQVQRVVSETRVEPDWVRLELTESTVMNDADAAVEMLNRMKAHGIRISMDDFGTGYSSLSYLHRIPFDVVKIDRSFIRDLGPRGNDEIVRAIVTLTRTLGMDVIAEGVENGDQIRALLDMGCKVGQGYGLGRPCDASKISPTLRQTGGAQTATALVEYMRDKLNPRRGGEPDA